jgi:tryptophanyl-tRNA synthetase
MKKNKRENILAGIRPTGPSHLGHYEGIYKNWVKLQDDYNCTYEIADLHTLTDRLDHSQLKENILEVAIDLISVGIDPEKSILFVQSDLSEHYELFLLLSMVTPVSWLERCPTYKEQVQQLNLGDTVGYGLLGYPVLQAVDICIHKGQFVPIGEDQLPHLEITREIVRRFNHYYGDTLIEPQPILSKTPRLLGTDNRKMSKSYNNAIFLKDTPDIIRKKVLSMITDPERKRRNDPGHPDVCNIFSYYKIFKPEIIKDRERNCMEAKIGCKECKEEMAETLIKYLSDFQKRRKELEDKPEVIEEILNIGAERAKINAKEVLTSVKEALKIV